MTGRTLVLLRHGRTPWNRAHRVQGHTDVALDEVGVAQAHAAAPVVAAYAPTLLWSSDLQRARRTAEAVAGATGLAVREDARLREFDLGQRQGLTHAEYAALAPAEHAAFARGEYDVVPGGETIATVVARVRAVVEDAAAALEPGSTGVLVSHGAALRVATVALLGWPQAAFRDLVPLGNCGWVVLRERTVPEPDRAADPGVDKGPEQVRWRLEAWNRRAPDPGFASPGGVG